VPAFVTQNGLGIPPGFALEGTPYWWKSNPTLTLEQYQAGDLGAIYRNLSFSLATTPAGSGTNAVSPSTAGRASTASAATAAVPKAAFGVRTTLWHGNPSLPQPKLQQCIDAIKPINEAANAAVVVAVAQLGHAPPYTDAELSSILNAANEAADAKKKELHYDEKTCTNVALVSLRRDIVVDAAAALSLAFPDDLIGNGKISGYSGWLTGGWLPSDNFSLLVLGRYFADGIEGPAEQRTLDVGAKLAYAWTRFGVALEGVYRNYLTGSADGHGYALRATAIFDVMLAQDFWVTLTLGRDYAPIDDSPLLALAGLKWNFNTGNARTILPPTQMNGLGDLVGGTSSGAATTPTPPATAPAGTPSPH
jgi:hypothetical protein